MSTAGKYILLAGLAAGLASTIYASFAAPHNGFDLSNSLIDKAEVLAGGPAKDGIPAIDHPNFIPASEARYLNPDDRILGIQIEGVSKAYPIAILNWHEIVNDEINDRQFAITYCPLCGTGVAFSSQVNNQRLSFGVSGLLYNSDVLLYDRETESLWSQIMGKAITGEMQGQKLQQLPIIHTNWSNWLETHPNSLVLSDQTGYSRDYQRNPYAGYENSRSLYFQVTHKAPDYFHPKERVLGLEVGDRFKAYPFSEIDKSDSDRVVDEFAGQQFIIYWDDKNQQASISDFSGNQVAAIEGFWFAWFTFHPETEVFRAKK